MKKKNRALPLIFVCIVAGIVAIAAVLAVKASNQSYVLAETDGFSNVGADDETTTEKHGFFENIFSRETTAESTAPDLVSESSSDSDTETASDVTDDSLAETLTDIITETEKAAEKVTTAVSTKAATTVASVNSDFYKVFTLPKSPKYVVKDSKIDFNTASLASYKYSPSGNYYYTDDKNAWQKGFGYSKIYDNLSIAVAMYYDTVRNTFTYDGKDYLVQFWKGQYGYYFVGGEIGIYTKTGSGDTYACADKSDWVNMEMTFMWDEDKNGNYKAIFTRPYDQYWWCTGFVIGFESEECIKSREQFRIVGHIQFKSTEMAIAFCNAMKKNGFTEVSSLDSSKLDSFVRVGPDVGFTWQNINQHVI